MLCVVWYRMVLFVIALLLYDIAFSLWLVVYGIVWAASAVQDLAATDWHFSRLDIRSSSCLPSSTTLVIIVLELQK